MSNPRVQRVLLQWEQNQDALKRTLAGNAQVSASIAAVGKQQAALQSTSKTLQAEFDKVARNKQFDTLALNFAKARAEGKGTTAEVERLTRALKALGATQDEIRRVVNEASRLGDEFERANIAAASGTTRRIGSSNLGRIGSELRMLPSIPIPGTGFGTDVVANMIRVGGAIEAVLAGTAVSFGAVASGALVVGAALAPVIIAFKDYAEGLRRIEEETKRRITTDIELRRDLLDATTNEIQARRQQIELQLQFQELVAAEVARQSVSAAAARIAAGEVFGPLTAQANALSEAATEETVALQVLRIQYETIIGLINENAGATNDAAEAERQLARLRADAQQQVIREADAIREAFRGLQEQEIRSDLAFGPEYFRALREGMPDALTSRLQGLNDERLAIEALLPRMEQRAQTDARSLETYRNAVFRLSEIEDQFDALGRTGPAAIQRLNQQLDADILNINTARDARITQLEADRTDKLLKAEDDRTAALTDAEDKRNDALLKLAQDQTDERLKIERDFNRSFGQAVGERDALAALQAKQKRDDDLANLRRDGEQRTKEIDKQYQDQQRVIDKRYRDQLKTINDAADKTIQTERDKAATEINTRRTAANQVLADLRTALINQNALQRAAWDAQRDYAQANVNYIRSLLAGVNVVIPNVVTPNFNQPVGNITYPKQLQTQAQRDAYDRFVLTQRALGIPGFASGLRRVPYNDFLMRAHRDERLLNRDEARIYNRMEALWRRGGTGGGTYVFQFDTKAVRVQSRQEAKRIFEEIIT